MRIYGAIALSCATLAAAPAPAQESGGDGRIITIGAGAQDYPRYPGSRARQIAPLPRFELDRPGEPKRFRAPDQGIGFGLLGAHSVIDIGPAVQFKSSRRAGRDVPPGVPGVGFTVE
ncbi:MAG: hypothetical protein QOJ94_156, partial [Sphingomonadales bacterium]|nr:hypothetical protein [Sphingomonadales bacterium]